METSVPCLNVRLSFQAWDRGNSQVSPVPCWLFPKAHLEQVLHPWCDTCPSPCQCWACLGVPVLGHLIPLATSSFHLQSAAWPNPQHAVKQPKHSSCVTGEMGKGEQRKLEEGSYRAVITAGQSLSLMGIMETGICCVLLAGQLSQEKNKSLSIAKPQ